ncbi:MAG TPA: hypothetical protein VLA41_10135 [Burkholderiales bacterium]|nr:hypothetical protein [Burkholderiales bacterium]
MGYAKVAATALASSVAFSPEAIREKPSDATHGYVSGGGKWQVHTASQPVVPGSFQGCLRYHGALTVPK